MSLPHHPTGGNAVTLRPLWQTPPEPPSWVSQVVDTGGKCLTGQGAAWGGGSSHRSGELGRERESARERQQEMRWRARGRERETEHDSEEEEETGVAD